MTNCKPKIICLMGPTAVGKTELAIELTKHLPVEIISVDSAMVYRGMDIGTAKPSLEELQIAPHHLIDLCDPKEPYSVGRFREDALQKIQEILARGRLPLLVGGTMLYFKVLQEGISQLPQADAKVRAKLKLEKDQLGLEALYQRLQEIDPKTATKLSRTDSQRIQRALEVYELTGESLSNLQANSPTQALPYEVLNLIIAPSTLDSLRPKIRSRFSRMLELGLIDEVNQLYQRGDLYPDLPSLRTVGYRQVWQYLAGQISYQEMLELIPIATSQLAKRQLTWLKRWQNAKWFDYQKVSWQTLMDFKRI